MTGRADANVDVVSQEVFLTTHHLAIALEYADAGDLSEFIDERAQQGVRSNEFLLFAAVQSSLSNSVYRQRNCHCTQADAPLLPAQIYGCSEEEARWFFQQFIIGLDYCHRMGIANRDIKLDNILLHGRDSRPVVKICDFGYSKDEVAGSICKTACGTPEYMAPEVRNCWSWICNAHSCPSNARLLLSGGMIACAGFL